jgi:activator of HSP90 ATPase
MKKSALKNNSFLFGKENSKLFFVIFIFIFFKWASVFSQTKTDVMKKAAQDSSKDIAIHQEVDFKVSPQKLYDALLSSKDFSASTKKSFSVFSENSATIDAATGGVFRLFDGHIIGRILELVPGRRIVEAWRVVDWPDGKYSIASFEISARGSGTHLSFDHIGFPAGLKEHLSEGWKQHYWDALTNYFQ